MAGDTGDTGIPRRRLVSGTSADVYLLGNGRALKVFNPTHYYKAETEYKRMLLADALGVPVPKAYGLTVAENGAPAIEMEYIPGENLNDYLRRHRATVLFFLYRLARIAARLHAVSYTYPEEEAAFARDHLDARHRFVSGIGSIARFGCILPEEIEKMRRFAESIPESRCFLHCDLDPTNVLVSKRGARLRVIDYGESGFGPWFFDLRRMYRKYYEEAYGYGKRMTMIRRLYFRYYLWLSLRMDPESKSRDAAAVLRVLGAVDGIRQLLYCVSHDLKPGDDVIRGYADKALGCIASLPDGLLPLDL